MSITVVLNQMAVILVLMVIGMIGRKQDILTDDIVPKLSSLIINICNPALMISSIYSGEMTATRQDLLLMAGISAIVYAILILSGFLLPRLLKVRGRNKKYYHMMMVYGNVGFIGIPVTAALLGSGAVIYVTIFNLFYSIFFYTHGIAVMQSDLQTDKKGGFRWKSMINIGTVTAVLVVILFWFSVPLPSLITASADYIGRCTTFLALAVLGTSVAKIRPADLFSDIRLYLFTLIRQLVLPIAVVCVLKQWITNTEILGVTVLMLSMPVGNMPLMLAQEQGEEAGTLATGTILTTLLSLITIAITTRFI